MAGVGLMTYLPQFFGTPEVRIGHGLVLGVGLLLAAAATRPTTVEAAAQVTAGLEAAGL